MTGPVPRPATAVSASAEGAAVESAPITLPTATGLHARPAAVLAGAAKRFKANVRLQRGDSDANAKSVVAIMGLEVAQGDVVRFVAEGADAQAVKRAAIEQGMDSLRDDGARKVLAGTTTIEEVLRVTQIEEHIDALAHREKAGTQVKS